MRRKAMAIAGIFVLGTAAVAAADSIGTRAVKPVTATFSATTVLKSSTRSCVGANGTISTTTLELGGASASAEPLLNGPLRVHLKATIDTAKAAGTVQGNLRVSVPGSRDTNARLDGVYSAGKVHGLLRGSAARPFQQLLADVSADLNTSSGLTNGKIGGTDAGGGAVLIQPGKCENAPRQRVVVTGYVSALTESSIAVAGITCAIEENWRQRASHSIRVGDRVEMTCRLDDSKLVLEKLRKARK